MLQSRSAPAATRVRTHNPPRPRTHAVRNPALSSRHPTASPQPRTRSPPRAAPRASAPPSAAWRPLPRASRTPRATGSRPPARHDGAPGSRGRGRLAPAAQGAARARLRARPARGPCAARWSWPGHAGGCAVPLPLPPLALKADRLLSPTESQTTPSKSSAIKRPPPPLARAMAAGAAGAVKEGPGGGSQCAPVLRRWQGCVLRSAPHPLRASVQQRLPAGVQPLVVGFHTSCCRAAACCPGAVIQETMLRCSISRCRASARAIQCWIQAFKSTIFCLRSRKTRPLAPQAGVDESAADLDHFQGFHQSTSPGIAHI